MIQWRTRLVLLFRVQMLCSMSSRSSKLYPNPPLLEIADATADLRKSIVARLQSRLIQLWITADLSASRKARSTEQLRVTWCNRYRLIVGAVTVLSPSTRLVTRDPWPSSPLSSSSTFSLFEVHSIHLVFSVQIYQGCLCDKVGTFEFSSGCSHSLHRLPDPPMMI